MDRFIPGGRVTVTELTHPLAGQDGTVRRLLRRDDSAWVEMDADLPAELVSFPDPEDTRHRHVLLFPEDCQPAVEA